MNDKTTRAIYSGVILLGTMAQAINPWVFRWLDAKSRGGGAPPPSIDTHFAAWVVVSLLMAATIAVFGILNLRATVSRSPPPPPPEAHPKVPIRTGVIQPPAAPNPGQLFVFQTGMGDVLLNPKYERKISGFLFIHNCLPDAVKVECFKRIEISIDSTVFMSNAPRQEWEVTIPPRTTGQVDLSVKLDSDSEAKRLDSIPRDYVTLTIKGSLALKVNGQDYSMQQAIAFLAIIHHQSG